MSQYWPEDQYWLMTGTSLSRTERRKERGVLETHRVEGIHTDTDTDRN